MTKRKIKMLAALLLVVTVASLIFYFSSQEGERSSETSGAIVDLLLPNIVPGYTEMAPPVQRPYKIQWGFIVRKTAHFLEYAALSVSLILYLRYLLEGRKPWIIGGTAWIGATLYACTDEWHQMFVQDRGPSPVDVLIDSSGALMGALLGVAVMLLWFRIKKKRNSPA